MLALEAKGQAVEGRSRCGVMAQGLGEVRRLSDDSGRGIEPKIDGDHGAFGDPACGTVRRADPDQAPPPHDRNSAAPPVTVDRDGDRGRAPERRASTTLFGISTPVALPEGMTFALNFIVVSWYRPEATPTVTEGIP